MTFSNHGEASVDTASHGAIRTILLRSYLELIRTCLVWVGISWLGFRFSAEHTNHLQGPRPCLRCFDIQRGEHSISIIPKLLDVAQWPVTMPAGVQGVISSDFLG